MEEQEITQTAQEQAIGGGRGNDVIINHAGKVLALLLELSQESGDEELSVIISETSDKVVAYGKSKSNVGSL